MVPPWHDFRPGVPNKAGERIDEDSAGASSVQPGQVTREKVGALLTTDDLPKVETVRIAKIERWASLYPLPAPEHEKAPPQR